ENRTADVDFRYNDGQHSIYARNEVILATGALNSPRLMQLSELGPGTHLQSIGISVKTDLPGVSANLQDHYVGRLVFESNKAFRLNGSRNPFHKIVGMLRHDAARSSVLTTTGFVAAERGASRPDMQIDLVLYNTDKFGETANTFPGFT